MRFPLVLAALIVAACSTDSTVSTTQTDTTVDIEPQIVLPPGILAAMPFQNRLDVAKDIFQMKLFNGTDEALPVVAVQFVWDGLTTPVADRSNILIAGDRLDYPVALAQATCVGDGTKADMPDPQQAHVRVLLADGRELQAPVFDVLHFAEKLYLADCERQFIATQVRIEWVGLQAAIFEDRPVTEGILRLTRLAGDRVVTIALIRPTIIFSFDVLDAAEDLVAVLPEGVDGIDVPVRFLEGRCDAHASAEVSQPFQFSATLDVGDNVDRTIALPIPRADQVAMRARAEEACEYLGLTGTLD